MFDLSFTGFRRLINIIINLGSIIAQLAPADELYKYFAHPESMLLRGKILSNETE